ncbi:MAG: sugar nucleotide-binding protein [bacterium]|nr:sugar nucleotide-binding protein [bacterium]
MRTIAVLGSEGMLGSMVARVLSADAALHVIRAGRTGGDVRFDAASEEGSAPLNGIDAEYFINCVGVLAKDIDEHDPISLSRAHAVNGAFPSFLARIAEAKNARVIHMSTDGVFSGKGGPYDESSPCDAPDTYGKTKVLGEIDHPSFLSIRCSIVGLNPKKTGLLEWFLAQPAGSTLRGYSNHVWNGVTTLQFAEFVRDLVVKDFFEEIREKTPVFHFAPNMPLTKYELLLLFKKVFNRDVSVESGEDPKGSIARVLQSKYSFPNLFTVHERTMEDALTTFASYA